MRATDTINDLVAELMADIESLASDHSRNEKLIHRLCPVCYPTRQVGDAIKALCGTERTYTGDRDRGDHECVVCESLCDSVILPCGHPGERFQ